MTRKIWDKKYCKHTHTSIDRAIEAEICCDCGETLLFLWSELNPNNMIVGTQYSDDLFELEKEQGDG